MRKDRQPKKGVWAAGTESCPAVLGARENMCLRVVPPRNRAAGEFVNKLPGVRRAVAGSRGNNPWPFLLRGHRDQSVPSGPEGMEQAMRSLWSVCCSGVALGTYPGYPGFTTKHSKQSSKMRHK